VVIYLCAAGASFAEKRAPEGWTVPLDQLGLNGSLESLPAPKNWQVKQVSSYDRSGGNADDKGGHQVYDGGVVMADLEGPGVVTRIWTRNPTGTLYIYVDDVEHPLLTFSFEDFFTGSLELWSPAFNLMGPPLVGESTGGYYSYIPIPYERHCRIIATTTEDALTYQVTYAELPKETPVQSFGLKLTEDDREFFRHWKDSWKGLAMRWPSKEEKMHKSRHNFWPGADTLAYPIEGPGVITEIELTVESADQQTLEGTYLAVRFDGEVEPSVYAPIGTFFGTATQNFAEHSSVVVGRVDGRMWCRFPMPFRESAEVRIVNTTQQVTDVGYWITWRPGDVGDARYFHAKSAETVTVGGKPVVVADIRGKGHYVGTTVAARNADSLTFLEGDDAYLVDGASADNFHGTGTDDYFNSGWYFATGPASAPTHAVTVKETSAPSGFVAFRSHLTEPVPFTQSFVFELEHGPNNDRPGVTYSSVAYWYQSPDEAEAGGDTQLAAYDPGQP
jgi:hypothetical protein